ncbi:MAG: hypothetical protein AAF621_02035 [Pseudomonadota bacterium]
MFENANRLARKYFGNIPGMPRAGSAQQRGRTHTSIPTQDKTDPEAGQTSLTKSETDKLVNEYADKFYKICCGLFEKVDDKPRGKITFPERHGITEEYRDDVTLKNIEAYFKKIIGKACDKDEAEKLIQEAIPELVKLTVENNISDRKRKIKLKKISARGVGIGLTGAAISVIFALTGVGAPTACLAAAITLTLYAGGNHIASTLIPNDFTKSTMDEILKDPTIQKEENYEDVMRALQIIFSFYTLREQTGLLVGEVKREKPSSGQEAFDRVKNVQGLKDLVKLTQDSEDGVKLSEEEKKALRDNIIEVLCGLAGAIVQKASEDEITEIQSQIDDVNSQEDPDESDKLVAKAFEEALRRKKEKEAKEREEKRKRRKKLLNKLKGLFQMRTKKRKKKPSQVLPSKAADAENDKVGAFEMTPLTPEHKVTDLEANSVEIDKATSSGDSTSSTSDSSKQVQPTMGQRARAKAKRLAEEAQRRAEEVENMMPDLSKIKFPKLPKLPKNPFRRKRQPEQVPVKAAEML